MSNLKSYRDRIASVKSTRKITAAMKMVAASKLRKAQDAAESSKPYAQTMEKIMRFVSSGIAIDESSPKLITGTGSDKVHLLVVITANRGLCGGFNSNIARLARREIVRLQAEGKEVKIICVGKKGRIILKRDYESLIFKSFFDDPADKEGPGFSKVNEISRYLLTLFDQGDFDVCSLVYNRFKNILVQEPVIKQLIPLPVEDDETAMEEEPGGADQIYKFEPDEKTLLNMLLPKNIGAQIYQAMLDSAAGEQAARMTAMDNATNAAGDMIDRLTLYYNRERQTVITNELIEIVSGAEAL